MPGLSTEGLQGATFSAMWRPLLRETLAKEGSFRFPLRGTSMRPTLPTECEIEVTPLPAKVPLGALIVCVSDDRLIAHRLGRRAGGRWIAQGDGRLGPDRRLASEQLLGPVSAAYQDGGPCWPTASSRQVTTFWVARHWILRPALAVQRALR